MTPPQFSDMWAQLTRPESGEFTMGDVAATVDGQRIRLAVDQEGFHHLLIPSSDFKQLAFSNGEALMARIKTVGIGRNAFETFLDIYCANESLTKTFDRLAAEIIDAAQMSSDPVDDALVCLEEWKNLFIRRRRRSLSPQQRIGLFAELSVLMDFAQAGEIVDTSCWTGPTKAPHDFEFETMSLEVKAYGAGSDQVTFHGPLQLDIIEGKPLFLCLRQIEEDANGNSLLELAEEIEDIVSDPQKFRTTINKLGVHDDDKALQESKYRIVKETLVEVTEATPRIVASSFVGGQLPAGIERLRYSVFPEDLISENAHADFTTWLNEVWE